MKKNQKNTPKKRIAYIDVLRAIAIILVLIGHITYQGFNTTELHRWIYSFHIPLFFFITGMTTVYTNYSQISLKNKILKHFYRIYLPFLIWAVFCALPTISPISIPYIIYGSHNSLMNVTNSSLWFFPTFFLSSILLDIILFFINKKRAQSKLPLILIPLFLLTLVLPPESNINVFLGCTGLPFGISIIPMALIFMLFGHLFETYRIKINHSIPFIPKFVIAVILFIITSYFALANTDTNYVLMAENRYGNLLFFYPGAIFGVLASTLTALFITKFPPKLYKLVSVIGTNTFVIFTFQRYPLILMNQFLDYFSLQNISIIFLIVITLFFVLPVCLLVSLFIKKYLPTLAGDYQPLTKYLQA